MLEGSPSAVHDEERADARKGDEMADGEARCKPQVVTSSRKEFFGLKELFVEKPFH